MKLLALYLPQFHTIPENDEWWGEGFTEWSNLKKAKPLFEGHYQPREPLNDNYYDLSDVNVMKRQVELAKENGIYGFCAYHYWFNGKLLLEKPMENYLADKSIDFPFCFCWANEHWTNAWVSEQNKILIENDFKDKDDWKVHFEYLLPFFKDDRYIKEDNKPLYVIYLPSIIEPLEEMLTYWNDLAKENGFDGIKFIYQHYMYYLDKKRNDDIFDYGIEFEPNLSINEIKTKQKAKFEIFKIKMSVFLQTKLHIYLRLKKRKLEKIKYEDVWNNILARTPRNDKMIPGLFVDWDNTPRKGIKGSVLVGASPEKFEAYFDQYLDKVKKEYKTDKMIVFAWNEWTEGGYLEPDKKYKDGYLKAIKKVLTKHNEFPR